MTTETKKVQCTISVKNQGECELAEKNARMPLKLSRGLVNYTIDVGILAMALLCAITGIIKWPGLVYSLGMSYANLPFDLLTTIHDWTGITMSLLALAHVVLHWKWLVAMTRKLLRPGRPAG